MNTINAFRLVKRVRRSGNCQVGSGEPHTEFPILTQNRAVGTPEQCRGQHRANAVVENARLPERNHRACAVTFPVLRPEPSIVVPAEIGGDHSDHPSLHCIGRIRIVSSGKTGERFPVPQDSPAVDSLEAAFVALCVIERLY